MISGQVSVGERKHLVRVRHIGTIVIFGIYAFSAIGFFWGQPDWARPIIVALIIAPPLIEFFLPKFNGVFTEPVGQAWLIAYLGISAIISVFVALTLASEAVRLTVLCILGAALMLSLTSYLFYKFPYIGSRRWRAIFVIASVSAAISLGIFFGSPMLRWACLGVVGSVVFTLIGPEGSTKFADIDRSRKEDRSNLYNTIRYLRDTEFEVQEWCVNYRPDEVPIHSLRSRSIIIRAIAILENLKFISPEGAKAYRSALLNESSSNSRRKTKSGHSSFDLLLLDIQYARARLEAHAHGATDRDLDILWQQAIN